MSRKVFLANSELKKIKSKIPDYAKAMQKILEKNGFV